MNDWDNSPANAPTASIWGENYFSGYYSFLRDNATASEARRDLRTSTWNAAGHAPTLNKAETLQNVSSPTSYDFATDNSVTYQVRFFPRRSPFRPAHADGRP